MAKRKKQYKANVVVDFIVKGISYKRGAIYKTDIKQRFDDLINLKKIKL